MLSHWAETSCLLFSSFDLIHLAFDRPHNNQQFNNGRKSEARRQSMDTANSSQHSFRGSTRGQKRMIRYFHWMLFFIHYLLFLLFLVKYVHDFVFQGCIYLLMIQDLFFGFSVWIALLLNEFWLCTLLNVRENIQLGFSFFFFSVENM